MSDRAGVSPERIARDKTPEVRVKRAVDHPNGEDDDRLIEPREKRRRPEDEEGDRERKRRSRHDGETEEEYAARKRARREGETDDEYEARLARYDEKERETPEEREARHRRRREREREREREEEDAVGAPASEGRNRDRDRDVRHSSRRARSGSRESYHSRRSSMRDVDMDRMRERERYDRDYDERRRYDRRPPPRDDRYDGRRDRYEDDYRGSPMRRSPPPRRRRSPIYDQPPRREREPSPKKDEAEALLDSVDSETRSVFVSQLAAALTSRDLGMFFEDKLGPGSVRDARVVTDRGTRRSKGIAYVELSSVENVNKAMGLSGTIVMGLPIMIAHSESEKNNQASTNIPANSFGPSTGPGSLPPMIMRPNLPSVTNGVILPNGMARDANADAAIPYHRLYVGNLFYSLTAEDIRQVFEPFGTLAFVDMPMEPMTNRSRGYAFVQYNELAPAEMALQSMNGFELAGRQIKVSTVHERGGGGPRLPGEQLEEGTNPNKLDAAARQSLMYKLARQEDPSAPSASLAPAISANLPPRPVLPVQQTAFVQSKNMFDPAEETEPDWHKDLEDDIKDEVQSKYGQLVNIHLDKNSSEGSVYMHFLDMESAKKAVEGLNGRFFAGKKISAAYIGEAFYRAHLP